MKQCLVFILLIIFSIHIYAEVKFCAVGDILLDRGVANLIEKHGVDCPYLQIEKFLAGNDLVFCNLECPLTEDGVPLNKLFSFKSKPENIIGLKNAGFNIISIANNHTIDMGRSGFLKTKDIIENNDMYAIGGGMNQEEARQPVIIECNGLRFAFFAYLDMLLESISYLEDKPAPAWASTEEIIKEIKKVRAQVDFVIVSFHWGVEFNHFPTFNQIEKAHQLIDAGADLILGHHPHVLQGIECYNDRFIVYSLGNFIFDQGTIPRRETMIFGCTFEKGRIIKPYFIPVMINKYTPELATGKYRKELIRKMKKYSGTFNINFKRANKKVYIIDKNGNDMFSVPIARFQDKERIIHVYDNKITLLKKRNLKMLDIVEFDPLIRIKDTCFIKDSDCARLYVILGKNEGRHGDSIAVIPIFEKEFGEISIDTHNFSQWKIMIADVDGDGENELCVGVWKTTKHDKDFKNRLFIYNRYENQIYPKWLGSDLFFTFDDFYFKDIDHNGSEELFLINNKTKQTKTLEWNGFGFTHL